MSTVVANAPSFTSTADQTFIPMDIERKRTKCEVWTRVIGYYRPVQEFNIGKKQEVKERVYYKEAVTLNSSRAQQTS
ncbi:hypothetical protein COT40_01645 [Candidatus Peregrinibacteria bacterium CG08_land_8_20_14_0_20_41_10]|nr:MAG: hypothetical protein COT40_01645 [Candidatus Peregrinibacteria bacterium CG08_land_8_20_14_0_20_41_10]